MRHKLEHLEMHISHSCNLQCKFCSHYCDIGYPGIVEHETGGEWIQTWSRRLLPDRFYILGGEPLLNPELGKYIRTAGQCFPSSKRIVVTNGLLLRAIEDLLPLFIATGTRLHISLHPVPAHFKETMEDAIRLSDRWLRRGLLVSIRPIQGWSVPYMGAGTGMVPYEGGTPEECFMANCGGKTCVNLHQGKIWKCPPLAYLPMVFDKLTNKERWRRFLEYAPIEPDAKDDEIANFLGAPSEYCDICPKNPRTLTEEEILRKNPGLILVHDTPSLSRVLWRGYGKIRKLLHSLDA